MDVERLFFLSSTVCIWIGGGHSCVKANTSQIEYRTEQSLKSALFYPIGFTLVTKSVEMSFPLSFNKSKAKKAIKRFDISLLLLKVVIF